MGPLRLVLKSAVPAKQLGKRSILSNNPRFETIQKLATCKDPWARGQRCIIPASSNVELHGRLARTSGGASAGSTASPGAWPVWSTWTDKETGELHELYTMVTGVGSSATAIRPVTSSSMHPSSSAALRFEGKGPASSAVRMTVPSLKGAVC